MINIPTLIPFHLWESESLCISVMLSVTWNFYVPNWLLIRNSVEYREVSKDCYRLDWLVADSIIIIGKNGSWLVRWVARSVYTSVVSPLHLPGSVLKFQNFHSLNFRVTTSQARVFKLEKWQMTRCQHFRVCPWGSCGSGRGKPGVPGRENEESSFRSWQNEPFLCWSGVTDMNMIINMNNRGLIGICQVSLLRRRDSDTCDGKTNYCHVSFLPRCYQPTNQLLSTSPDRTKSAIIPSGLYSKLEQFNKYNVEWPFFCFSRYKNRFHKLSKSENLLSLPPRLKGA